MSSSRHPIGQRIINNAAVTSTVLALQLLSLATAVPNKNEGYGQKQSYFFIYDYWYKTAKPLAKFAATGVNFRFLFLLTIHVALFISFQRGGQKK
jgi:hypothetical protein